MDETLVSPVVQQLLSIMDRKQKQEVRLAVCFKKAVDKLVSNLTTIQAVFAEAESRQMKERLAGDWLEKLNDVAYDIEDVLDDWEAAIVSSQSKPGDEQDPDKTERKVFSFLRSFSLCYKQVGLYRKLKNLNGSLAHLAHLAQEQEQYKFALTEVNPPNEPSMTTSMIDTIDVKGREEDRNVLVNKLLSEPSDGDGSDLRVFSVVGMRGIGMTPLAQYVFNDDRLGTYFDRKIWVCVSDRFDDIRIAEAIFESLFDGSRTPNICGLEDLLGKIRESIEGKNFLLVLNDVHRGDPHTWYLLKRFLKFGLPGSKVLMTTQNGNIASIMSHSKDDILHLKILSDEDCWLILSRLAFFGENHSDYKYLEDIGIKISTQCRGLPDAARSLGGILRLRKTREEWQHILNSEIWKLVKASGDLLFAPVWLSYGDLSPILKRCFYYCAIFPENYVIDKRTLIELWMAQGYLGQSYDLEIEIAENYFQNLASHSFLQVFEENKFDYRVSCKVNNVVYDLARIVAGNECCRVQADHPPEPIKGRHVAVTLSNRTTFPPEFEGPKKIRSLLFLQSGRRLFLTTASLSILFCEVTHVRSLSLRGFVFVEIPSSIRKLVQLRWLDLSYNGELKLLPETLCELYHLQTIDVSGCCGLKLPRGIGQLIDLRHLRNSGGPSRLPKGIARLTGLRTLEEVDVGCGGNAFSLGDLKNFNQLRGRLEIRNLGAYKRHVGEAKQAELKKKEHITNLVLRFSHMEQEEEEEEEEGEGERCTPRNEEEEEEEGEGERCIPRNEEDEEEEEGGGGEGEGDGEGEGERSTPRNEELLEALEPSPNLEILGISDYGGTAFPDWMISLTNLRHVRLSDFYNSDHLPSLGKLPSLETLTLVGMSRVEKVGLVLLGIETSIGDSKREISASSSSSSSPVVVAFPKLKKLQFSLMRSWEEWDDYYDGTTKPSPIIIMPSLRFLRIFDCMRLKALPDYILQNTTLETLQIGGSDLLRDRYNEENGEDRSKISHITHVKIYH